MFIKLVKEFIEHMWGYTVQPSISSAETIDMADTRGLADLGLRTGLLS
jgi:hypothetical protein